MLLQMLHQHIHSVTSCTLTYKVGESTLNPHFCGLNPGLIWVYSYGHLPVTTGCKWDYTYYKWVISTYN